MATQSEVSAPTNRSVFSRTPVLENLSFGRRALAYSAVVLGNIIAASARDRTRGTGDLLVAFANLGDQLPMMNVWSRYALRADPVDVVCNWPTGEAFTMYPCVRAVREYAAQGAGSLADSLRSWWAMKAPYTQSFVPHPFFTRPIALAYARTHSSAVFAMAGRGTMADTTIPLDQSSWRATYERFAAACFPKATAVAKPRLIERYQHVGRGSRRMVLHPISSAQSRTLDALRNRAIAQAVLDLGLRIFVVGSAAEEARLRSIFDGLNVTFICGAPLCDVARILCESDLFIGVDSSIMQLADALGLPSVVIYTTTCAEIAGPYYVPLIAIEPSSCFQPIGVQPEQPWRGLSQAGYHISVDAVVDAVRRLLGT